MPDAGFIDFVEWFDEDEREVCADCGRRECLTVAGLAVCAACNVVRLDGERVASS